MLQVKHHIITKWIIFLYKSVELLEWMCYNIGEPRKGGNYMAEKRVRVAVSLTPETAEKLSKLAEAQGLTKSALLTVWVNRFSESAQKSEGGE